jgi:hypothetical protein
MATQQERKRPLRMVREGDELGAPTKRRMKKVNEVGHTEWVQPREVPVYPVHVEPGDCPLYAPTCSPGALASAPCWCHKAAVEASVGYEGPWGSTTRNTLGGAALVLLPVAAMLVRRRRQRKRQGGQSGVTGQGPPGRARGSQGWAHFLTCLQDERPQQEVAIKQAR